jgi:hypothetical protein
MNKFTQLSIATIAVAAISFALAPAWAQSKNSTSQTPAASKSADAASLPDQ